MAFYNELLAATEAEQGELLSIPFLCDGAAGKISLDDYVAFLAEAYQHVKHTLPLLMACGARLPQRLEWLRRAMGKYVIEESGHQDWILNDIRACGGDADTVRNAHPSLPVELMVAYAYDTIERGNPAGFLGMVLVLEGASVRVATQAARALQGALRLPDAAFTYLSSHGALDIGHLDFYASLVNRLDDAADREAVIHCARVFYKLYGDIFRHLDNQRRLSPPRKEAA